MSLNVFERMEFEFLLNKIPNKYRKEIADVLSKKKYDPDSELEQWINGKDIDLTDINIEDTNTFYKTMDLLRRFNY